MVSVITMEEGDCHVIIKGEEDILKQQWKRLLLIINYLDRVLKTDLRPDLSS